MSGLKDKYVRFSREYPHYQVAKFNGTKGLLQMTPEMIGMYKKETDTYVFPEVNGIIPEFIAPLLLGLRQIGFTVFGDGFFDQYSNDEEKEICDKFETRVFIAKSRIDLRMAELYFAAAQLDRLSIKASVTKLFRL